MLIRGKIKENVPLLLGDALSLRRKPHLQAALMGKSNFKVALRRKSYFSVSLMRKDSLG